MTDRTQGMGRLSSVAALALIPFLFTASAHAQNTGANGQPSTAKGDWPMYFADPSGSRYSPLDQINASNFNQLVQAWHFKTDNLGARPEFKLEGTPLEINGTIYTTGGSRRAVIALNAKTGELKWVYSMDEGARAALAPRQLSGRGVSYWTDGGGDERILYVTTGYRLVELDAKTGQPIESFGDHGIIDMKVGAYTGVLGQPGEYKQIDLTTGEIGLHTTPTVVNNTVIVGSSMKEGAQPLEMNNTKGLVRAWDVKTGKLLWTFHDIPRKGEFGYDSWENNSADYNGNTGVWTGITVDPELNSVYLPVEDPTNDYYGGGRPGNDLFGDSLVCVDFTTGKMKWYYQIVHHPIWDYDLSSPPLLVDITVNGKAIKAVAVPSKESFLYVFDRVTGKPIWPIVERPVPQSDVPAEKTSKTQPFPTKPKAYGRNAVTLDDLVDFTPELRARAADIIKKYYKMGPMFSPAVAGKVGGPYGVVDASVGGGGTNWPGAGFNPQTHVVFAPAQNGVSLLGVVEPPQGLTDNRYLEGTAGQPFRINGGPGFGSASDAPKVSADQAKLNSILADAPRTQAGPPPPRNLDGIPLIKPPYGVLTAINLDTGDTLWQVPHGDTPDEIKNNPALRGLNIGKTGQSGNVGEVITKSLVVMGDPQYSTQAGHPRGAYLRAYDQKSGQQVGAVWMPAPQSGSPMTYMYDRKQYIIVAVSGGNYSGDYIAYSIPSSQ
ncbi:MAG TPA: PQQ-binding-like beta-propeller repeat protein [Rhizomicrobium sp.]|nr:PQQ-binding-like beta-propeller repeat protein [Rhizomicrobium sp.]